MVYSPLLVAFAAVISNVHGHYTFMRVAHNGKWADPLQYVRNHTDDYWEDSTPGGYSNRPRTYNWWISPVDRPESVRCGRDNMAWAKTTDVLSVRAGDQMEFASISDQPNMWKDPNFNNCPEDRGTCWGDDLKWDSYPWYHPGPVVVHISRVPDGQDVRSYDGTGEWIKLYTLGLKWNDTDAAEPLTWLGRNSKDRSFEYGLLPGRVIFTLPKETPKGQYLVRAASVYPGASYVYNGTTMHGETQLYHSCAQIEIESDATGTLPKGVMIPEAFQYGMDGLSVSEAMYNGKQVDEGYKYPGGPLWTGTELVDDKPVY